MATLKYAITNVARVGATPVGYVPSRPFVYVNGTDRSAWVLTSSLNINQQLDDMADTCDFLMRVPVSGGTAPVVGQTVSVRYGTTARVEFSGRIMVVEAMPRRTASRFVRYRVSCVDRTWEAGANAFLRWGENDLFAAGGVEFGRRYYKATNVQSVAYDVYLTSSIVGNSVSAATDYSGAVGGFYFTGLETPAQALKRVAEVSGARWDISPDAVLTIQVSRPTVVLSSTSHLSAVRKRTDFSQVRTRAVIACGDWVECTSAAVVSSVATYHIPDGLWAWQGGESSEAGELPLAVLLKVVNMSDPNTYDVPYHAIYTVDSFSQAARSLYKLTSASSTASVFGAVDSRGTLAFRPFYLRVNSTAAAASNSAIGRSYIDFIMDNTALTISGARLVAKSELALRATAESQLEFESVDLDANAGVVFTSSITTPIDLSGSYLAQSASIRFRSGKYPIRAVTAGGYKRDLYTLIKQLDAGLR